MSSLGSDGAYILAAGYSSATALIVVNAIVSLTARWRCCETNRRRRSMQHQREANRSGDELSEAGGDAGRECTSSPPDTRTLMVQAVVLCLILLGASFSELLIMPKGSYVVRHSRPLKTVIVSRMAMSAAAVLWLLLRRRGCYGSFGSSGRGVAITAATAANAACAGFLGFALLCRSAHLAVYALGDGASHVDDALVYLEGLCAFGSLAAMSIVWQLLRREIIAGTPGVGIPSRDQMRRETEAEVDGGGALDSASWVSLLTFSWLNKLFETGASRQLRSEDLPGLARKDGTVVWAERFAVDVRNEHARPGPSSLVRVCLSTFGLDFLKLGWLKAANTALGFSGPLLLKVVVDAVQDASESEGSDRSDAAMKGYLGATGLACAFALSAVLDTQFSLGLGRLQLHVRAAIVSAVYRQVLGVRSVDAAGVGLTAGSAANLIAVDAQRLMDTAGSLHELWGLPLQVGVTFFLLHREVSFAFAAGLVVITAMIPLNAALAKRIGVATRELMGHKDDRVQRCSEVLHGIRAVKMLAWEGCVGERIDASRQKEVSALTTLKYVDAWCVFFWATTPTLVCLVTFATLVIVRGEGAPPLRVSSVFAAVSLLRMLIHPMNAFPWVINGIVEAGVSKTRLEKLLLPLPAARADKGPFHKGGDNDLVGRTTSSASVDAAANVGPDANTRAILSWQGVTIALSRERSMKGKSSGDGRLHSRSAEKRGGEGKVPGSSPMEEGGSVLEPLLPPGADEDGAMEGDRLQGGEKEFVPAFSLGGVSLEVRRGEAVAIVGGVGTGKSTLIAGILGEVPVFPANGGAGSDDNDGGACGGDHNDGEYDNTSSRDRGGSETASPSFRGVRGDSRGGMSINAGNGNDSEVVGRENGDAFRHDWGGVRSGGERRRRRRGQGARGTGRGWRTVPPLSATAASSATKLDGDVRVCYAAQNPWVLSGTVRENIIFGLPYHQKRYRAVLDACALTADLAGIPGGDTAYVGERGATLSGGQRLRVSLARCAYFASAAPRDADPDADPVPPATEEDSTSTLNPRTLTSYNERGMGSNDCNTEDKSGATLCLLDDPLTSLDAHTREHVLHRCIHGLMRGNPEIAVVVTCGEIHDGENTPVFHEDDKRSSLSLPPPSRSFDRVVSLGNGSGNTGMVSASPGNFSGAGTRSLSGPTTGAAGAKTSQLVSSATLVKAGPGTALAAPAAITAATTAAALVTDTAEVDEAKRLPRDVGSEDGDGGGEVGVVDAGGVSQGGEGPGIGDGAVEEEERKDGSVEVRVYLLYIKSAGLVVTAVTLLSLTLMQATAAGFNYWLSHWATQQGRISVRSFLIVSFSIATANAAFTLVRAFGFAFGGVRAAVVLHRRLLSHVLAKRSAFFDVTPSGRVVNRFSRDTFSVDDPLPFHLNVLLAQAAGLMATAVVLSSTSPIVAALFLPLGWVYARLQRYYRSSSRELRRLDSTSRSPIYALFSETLDGAVTIRAFGQQEAFFRKFVDVLSQNQRATFAASMASAWLSLRLQGLGVVVVAAVAFLAVAQQQIQGGHGTGSGIFHGFGFLFNNGDHESDPVGDAGTNADGSGAAAGGSSSYYGLVGLSLTYALPIVGNLTGLLGALTETEREMISVERMDEYCRGAGGGLGSGGRPSGSGDNTSGECLGDNDDNDNDFDKSTNTTTTAIDVDSNQAGAGDRRTHSTPRASRMHLRTREGRAGMVSSDWPTEGRLEVCDLVMRYRRGLSPSLKGVSLTVRAGEKVGIVGRTGSGKTSLLRAVFGMYPYGGRIDIDGVDISTLPVHVLRSRLAVIPQEPLLFQGTVRENLDPSGEHTDASLWHALRSSRLTGDDGDGGAGGAVADAWTRFRPPADVDGVRDGAGILDRTGHRGGFGLDSALDGYGANMSAGQRQLLCIARALLRKSKIVCVDEATSRMDAATAKFVDAAMAEAFRGATVLTVAHRLPAVLASCDRVVVMSEGTVIEEGRPRDLAADSNSRFSALLRAQD